MTNKSDINPKPSQEIAEEAVTTLLRWIGEDPEREGLRETPKRVVKALKEWCSGYELDPYAYMRKTFSEIESYDDMVVLRDIRIESHCEHHLAPIVGVAHVGYIPAGRVVGISKLARVVEAYAKRLQVQEKMTSQIAQCIQEVIKPKGVAVIIEAEHHCITTRGIHRPGAVMATSHMLGLFRSDPRTREEFLRIIGKGK